MRRLFALLIVFLAFTPTVHAQKVRVKSHVTKKGMYVPSHIRTAPNKKRTDNYSSKPNVNPYTGKKGTVDPYRARARTNTVVPRARTKSVAPKAPSSRPKVQAYSAPKRIYAAPRKRRVTL